MENYLVKITEHSLEWLFERCAVTTPFNKDGDVLLYVTMEPEDATILALEGKYVVADSMEFQTNHHDQNVKRTVGEFMQGSKSNPLTKDTLIKLMNGSAVIYTSIY